LHVGNFVFFVIENNTVRAILLGFQISLHIAYCMLQMKRQNHGDDEEEKEEVVAVASSNKKYLASYTAKTAMMWTSESVDESWWTEDNAAECLTLLLFTLQSAFECRTLHHYFVSSVNLLEGLPVELATRVVAAINSILDDPAAIAGQLEEHFDAVQLFLDALPEQIQYGNRLRDILDLVSQFGVQVGPQ